MEQGTVRQQYGQNVEGYTKVAENLAVPNERSEPGRGNPFEKSDQ